MNCRLLFLVPILLTVKLPAVCAQASLHNNLFAEALQRHAVEGRINFAGLKEDPGLAGFLKAIAAVDPAKFRITIPSDASAAERREAAQFERDSQVVFWVNAHNALALKAIADRYDGKLKSVRQIRDFATRPIAEVAGKPRSLREIEELILRRELKEPRAVFLLYRGMVGGPRLPPGPVGVADFQPEVQASVEELLSRKALTYRVDTIGRILWLPDFLLPYEKAFPDGPLGLGRFVGAFLSNEREKRFLAGNDEFEVKFWQTDNRLELPPEKKTDEPVRKK